MAASLSPLALTTADYPIAQTPSLGSEFQAYYCSEPAGILKSITYLGGSDYEAIDYASSFGGSGIAATVVGLTGLNSEIANVITVPSWSVNRSTRFQTGKAGEGTIVAPYSFGTRRGEHVYTAEIPGYDPSETVNRIWYPIGAVTTRSFKLPVRETKTIAEGLNTTRWSTTGRTTEGELSLSSMNLGFDEGLGKIMGQRVHVMLKVMREGAVEVARLFFLNYTPTMDVSAPEGDGESSLSASGKFSLFAFFTAPGA